MNTDKLIEVCDTIITETENDVKEFDGMPFTGRTVGEMHGKIAAAITALAQILKEILKDKQ